MKKRTFLAFVAIGAIFGADAASQDTPRALWLDTTSGAVVGPGKEVKSNAKRSDTGQKPLGPPALRVNTGLMYYIDRERPGGRLERVLPSTTFHSGERIRLQLMSNVAGRLRISQRNPDGTSDVLFPDSRVNGGDDRIEARTLAVLPSGKDWFTFDKNPGEEHILVELRPQGSSAEPEPMRAEIPRKETRERTEEVALLAEGLKTRGLKMEIDDSKASPATYCVMPAGKVLPQGVLAVEIVLVHR